MGIDPLICSCNGDGLRGEGGKEKGDGTQDSSMYYDLGAPLENRESEAAFIPSRGDEANRQNETTKTTEPSETFEPLLEIDEPEIVEPELKEDLEEPEEVVSTEEAKEGKISRADVKRGAIIELHGPEQKWVLHCLTKEEMQNLKVSIPYIRYENIGHKMQEIWKPYYEACPKN